MCGINGIVGGSAEIVRKMSAATAHRGPDAEGLYTNDDVCLAHNRLSIIDLSEQANQPMKSPDGKVVIVFNGEIYNFRELRSRLKNWNFKTKSDTEVLLAAYEEWGDEMLQHINGMFAFAIWDAEKRALLLARDRMGIKPLFYTQQDGKLYFSSELRAIVAGTNCNRVSTLGVSRFIGLNYVPGPETAVENIYKLPAAHYAWYKENKLTITRYWTPQAPKTYTVSAHEVRETLAEAVTSQLVSDRTVGVFLSGGFDSSIVTYHAAKEISGIRTFTSRFELEGVDTAKYNVDADRAEMTAKQFGTNHRTCVIRPDDVINYFEASLRALDEPVANMTTVSQYILSKWMREDGVVVALGGDGGDELFAGYERQRMALAASYFQTLPKFIRGSLSKLNYRFGKLNTPLDTKFHMSLMAHKPYEYESVIKNLAVQEEVTFVLDTRYKMPHITKLQSLDRFMRVDRETWLVDESLAHTDGMSMIHGLEIRVPFLDERVVAMTDRLYGKGKCTLLTGKKIMRDAYRGIMPGYLYEGPKRGWFPPGAKWLRDPKIKAFAHEVFSDSYYGGLSSHVDWVAAQKMLDDHVNGSYHLYPLWSLLVLQVWARQNELTF